MTKLQNPKQGCSWKQTQTLANKKKIIQRHSPIFGENLIPHREPSREQCQKSSTDTIGTLAGISRAQPALTRAIKLQKRAARVGFDWTGIDPVLEKIAEELEEVRAELSSPGNPEKLQGEIGDLLFACINLARHVSVDPETAIHNCNDKFERRFRYIESVLSERGSSPAEASLEEMDTLWEKAKSKE
jgi:MazG family protein